MQFYSKEWSLKVTQSKIIILIPWKFNGNFFFSSCCLIKGGMSEWMNEYMVLQISIEKNELCNLNM
jgi:hypothetical protein